MDLYDSMLQSAAAHRLQRARVQSVPAQHSWVSLPGPWVSTLLDNQVTTPLVIKLTPVTPASQSGHSPFASSSSSTPAVPISHPRYVAWGGSVSTSPGCIELPSHLSAALALRPGAEVLLQALPQLAAAAAVMLEPLGPADWEVVELNAGLLEEHVLGQAGVVVLGQPLVVWARQAKVTLKVTQIIHNSSAAAAGGVKPLPGQQLNVQDVARLDQGTELHIAPKPRVTAAGPAAGLGPGNVPLDAAGKPDLTHQQQGQGKGAPQQQQQQRRPVWMRVCCANARHLLSTSAGHEHPDNTVNSSSSSSSNNSNPLSAAAEPGSGFASGGCAAVSSWLTTAVLTSSKSAADLGLKPGEIVRLSSSSSSSSSSRGQSVLPLQSLVLTVLVDESTPWGHVALSPPLLQGLGLTEHQYVRLKPLCKQQQMQQMPGWLLHPLLPSGSSGCSSSRRDNPLQMLSVAAAVTGGASVGRPTSSTPSQQQQQQDQQPARAQQQPWQQQPAVAKQQQQQQATDDSFSGAGLVLDTFRGLLALPLQVVRLQTSLQQQQHLATNKMQQQQQGSTGVGQRQGSQGDGGLDVLVKPEVAGAAVLTWLQLQMQAAAQQIPPAPAPAAAATAAESAFLPVCGPMLVHIQVRHPHPQQQQNQQQEQQLPGDVGMDVEIQQYLLLLVPVGEQLTAAAAAKGVSYLPANMLLQMHGTPKQQQQQQLAVQVSKTLSYDAAAAAVSGVAQQYQQYVSCIHKPSQHHCSQQQQQQDWLDLQEYPWLNPALQSSTERLKPRLDLLTWQAWQSVELPLPGGVLLVGGSEGGRGWLLTLIGQEAAAAHSAHVVKVCCKSLAGQSYDTSVAVLSAAAAEALSCCPGLLLLDDLDLLMPAPNTDGPVGLEQDQATATRLAEWLSTLMRWSAQQPQPLSFVAAVSAAAALPAALRAAGCFDCEVKVPALGSQGRAALLLAGFREKGLGFEGGMQGLEALARKGLEGFDARDLQLVVDRAVHAALHRGMTAAPAAPPAAAAPAIASSDGTGQAPGSGKPATQQQQQQQLMVTRVDVEQALSGFVAAAFWRAGQQKGQGQRGEGAGGLKGWQDVGGLPDAVSALKEALVLPAKYGHLLAAAPLRLRTGLLLFGPPGCGKTHVVAAAVAATGARLISVKGPELLNKYIGQSEAAVRELFSRAAAAAPCVLFFDEFDAIAPPRGHDSTGVTDRVVNQLLTELDGVEGLTGVAVLAATSRPDLIDAALLRPGRLDRMVYCGFPNQADRLAILQAVGHKLALAADVSLQDIATQTEGFTGADLAAILSEAQLLAVHDQIDSSAAAGPDASSIEAREQDSAEHGACVLTAQHVQRALSRARPSLPPTERQRLQAVYARFQQSRDPGLSNRPNVPEDDTHRVKHATLA